MVAVSCRLFSAYNHKLPYLIDQAELSHGAGRLLRFRVTLVVSITSVILSDYEHHVQTAIFIIA
jgi:hypothetical protein